MEQDSAYYNHILHVSGQIIIVFQIIAIGVGVWKYKYLDKPLRVFLSYYIIGILLNIVTEIFIWAVNKYTAFFSPILKYWHIEDTNFLSILGYLANFGVMGYYFMLVLQPHPLSKYVKWLSIGLLMSTTINYCFIEGYNVLGVFNPVVDGLFSIIIPLFSMWVLFNHVDMKIPMYKNSYFWINLRFIVPNLIALFMFWAGDKLYQTDFSLYVKINLGRCVIFIIGHIMACISFYFARYTKFLK